LVCDCVCARVPIVHERMFQVKRLLSSEARVAHQLCVCVSVCACVRVCVCACVCLRVWACVRVRERE